MRLKYKIWGLAAACFSIGLLAGLILPHLYIVVLESVLVLFIAFCWLCS